MRRIYLDNAATSWPKPDAVYEAVDHWQREVGASYARGESPAAGVSRAVVDDARRAVAQLIGESDPRRVVFTTGGTESLNTALFGVLRDGDHVVTTVCEHNAVLRPLAAMSSGGATPRVETTYVGCDEAGLIDPLEVLGAIRPTTRLVAVTHASNVTGAVQPVEAIAHAARERGVLVVVDAAQTLGRWPVDVRELGVDLLAAPGHKGLLGPLGTGVLWVRDGLETQLRTRLFGGAAVGGDRLEMPKAMPHRLEAGSLNMPGLAGLLAGVRHVEAVGVDSIRATLAHLRLRLAAGLDAIDGVTVFGPSDPVLQAGVVSFSAEAYDPHELAMLLACTAGVESRAGLHCAPRLHDALGTAQRRGLVRFSPGLTTTDGDLDEAVAAVRRLTDSPIS